MATFSSVYSKDGTIKTTNIEISGDIKDNSGNTTNLNTIISDIAANANDISNNAITSSQKLDASFIDGGSSNTSKLDSSIIPIASTNVLGGVKIGDNLTVDLEGKISATASGSVSASGSTTLSLAGFIETQKLLASDGELNDKFSRVVAIDGNYAIVGTEYEKGPNNQTSVGAAYIYETKDGGITWTEVHKLAASGTPSGAYFGVSVAISGKYAVVGSFTQNSVYVFKRNDDGTWGTAVSGKSYRTQTVTLSSSDQATNFGIGVATDGNNIIVSSRTGYIYFFKRNDDGTWGKEVTNQSYRTENDAYNTGNNNYGEVFGQVGIDGNYAIVGNYNPPEFLILNTSDNGETWTPKLTIERPTSHGNFSKRVAISGNYVIVSEQSYESNKGAAYIYKTTDGWSTYTEQRIIASDGVGGDLFGISVAIDGNYAIVGAYREDGPNDTYSNAGAAYIFQTTDDGDTWTEVQKLYASDINNDDEFGWSVAISGNNVIIGSHFDDDKGSSSGSAYIFGAKFGIPNINSNTISAKSIKIKSGTVASLNDINHKTLSLSDLTTKYSQKNMISSSNHTAILLNTGEVMTCGRNDFGPLGINQISGAASNTNILTSMVISGNYDKTNAVAVSCGSIHTIVLLNTGEVLGCGNNDNLRLGTTTTNHKQPTLVSMDESAPYDKTNAVAISCGNNHTVILLNTGEVMGCGHNGYGQIGDGNTNDPSALVSMLPSGNYDKTNAIAISCGGYHTAVLLNTGEVMGCARNYNGQLGTNESGGGADKTQLVSMLPSGNYDKTNAVAISCGSSHTAILLNTGETCGNNGNGQLGDVGISGNYDKTNAVAISCGSSHTSILLNTGEVMTCGYNNSGQLGDGSTTKKTTLVSMLPIGNYDKTNEIMAVLIKQRGGDGVWK